MNTPIVNKGDRIMLPWTPGGAKVNPNMWPTGYRVRYGEPSRFYVHPGSLVTVVDARGGEIVVRHVASKSTVLLTVDDLTNPVLDNNGETFDCEVCSCPFTVDEFYDRHDTEDDGQQHAACCQRSGSCAETGAYDHEDSLS